MNGLVTGGTGLLGSRIARVLVREGARVRITCPGGATTRAVGDISVEHRPADNLDEAAIKSTLQNVEVVFHTAAVVRFDPRRYDLQYRVDVQGTRLLLLLAVAAEIRRFLHTSTVNTLGIPEGISIGDENTPYNWGPFRLGYLNSKRASERYQERDNVENLGLGLARSHFSQTGGVVVAFTVATRLL